jgi:hypothetical protein
MVAEDFTITLLPNYQNTWRHILENRRLNSNRREHLSSHMLTS